MNAKQWRAQGYLVVFRRSIVILRNKDGKVWRAMVDNGKWMDKKTIEEFESIAMPLANLTKDLDRTEKLCYCNNLANGNCDFCSGMRTSEHERV